MDWQAFGAIATAVAAFGTLAAVLIALWPLRRERVARQAKARSLRAQLVLHFTPATHVLSRRLAAGDTSVLTPEENTEIAAIVPLLSQVDLLTAREFDKVVTAGAHLIALCSEAWPPSAKQLKQAQEAVVKAADLMVKGEGVLHEPRSPKPRVARNWPRVGLGLSAVGAFFVAATTQLGTTSAWGGAILFTTSA